MKLYQFSCIEGKKVDLRQADAVLRHRPDAIIFEAPSSGRTPSLVYNKYRPSNKPLAEVAKHKKKLKQVSKKYPWVLSDISVYDNIVKLWKEGVDVKLYNVDASSELLRVGSRIDHDWNPKPHHRGTHFQWWVRIYLREKIMAENIQWVVSKNKKKDLKVLIFLQSFHWRNVQFLMSNPTKKQIYEYYFGKFKDIEIETIGNKIKKENKILYKYWKKVSDFV